MTPILFAPSATVFTTNGVGRLTDTISAEVKEERNGVYELTLVYPVTGRLYSEIGTSSIIVAKPSPAGSQQAFRVYKISRPISGRVTIYCRHISYQLNFIPVKPFSAASLAGALSGLRSNALETCPFTFSADFANGSSYSIALPGSIRSYLGGRSGSIIDVYGNGAEWEWDNYSCTLHAHRGQNRGVVLRYGKQITDLKQEENIENTITGVVPYWQSDATTVYLSTPVSSATAANFPFPRTVVKDWTDKWENAPTTAQLQAYAESYVASSGFGVPKVSVTVDFVRLADTLEYADIAPLETVELCDTIAVYFEKLGVTSYSAKVITTTYDVLKERYSSIQIGDARYSLADTIEDNIESIAARPTTSEMGTAIDKATGVLNSATRGHVIIKRNSDGWANELYFVDNENIYDAVHALRLNYAGIGFSSSGIDGVFAQSWTLDGHMSLGGINNAYGDFKVLDENALPTVQMDKYGLRLWQTTAIGYYSGGTFYSDAALTTAITPETDGIYYDLSTYAFYIWNGSAYNTPSGAEGLAAKMTHDGFGLYSGEIDIKWNGQTGIYFQAGDGSTTTDELKIGDFMVASQANYGRQIWESSDEMTGMSGEPEDGQYFLWAGWRSDSDFALAVENHGGSGADIVAINGSLQVNGVDVMDYIYNLEIAEEEETEGGVTYDGVTIDMGDATPIAG